MHATVALFALFVFASIQTARGCTRVNGALVGCTLVGKRSVRSAPQKYCNATGSDWHQFGQSCFKVHVERFDYEKARALCQLEGGLPASINSKDEEKFVEGLVVKHAGDLKRTRQQTLDSGLFIGLVKRQFGHIFQFMWEDSK